MTITYVETLLSEHCCSCGIPFGLPTDFRRQRLDDHRTFWCPNGHSQHYTGKTDAQKLREANEELERERRRRRATRELLKAEERSHASTRGHVTRKRKQLANVTAGVCPVDGCHRHFQNLERHIATKHHGVVT